MRLSRLQAGAARRTLPRRAGPGGVPGFRKVAAFAEVEEKKGKWAEGGRSPEGRRP